MSKEGTNMAPVVLLLFSIGLSNAVYAEGNSNFASLSEDCRKASEEADNPSNSLPKALCRRQYEMDKDFDALLRQADGLTGQTSSDTERKEVPEEHARVERPTAAPPRRHAKARARNAHHWGGTGFASSHKPHTQVIRNRRPTTRRAKTRVVSTASIRAQYYIGRKLRDLTPAERRELKSKYKSLLTRKDVNRFLDRIEKKEDGALLRIVGGTRHKSRDCQKRIAKLNTSGHPREQHLPCRCFFSTRKYGLSTASGKYQITYTNWRILSRRLALEDFSAPNQKIAALELVRSSSVKGSRVGTGFIALVQGDEASALRLGTDPWASFPGSRWYSGSARLPQSARRELKRSGKGKYARHQSDDNFRRTTIS
jgi:muramidase (phage lysozyme)